MTNYDDLNAYVCDGSVSLTHTLLVKQSLAHKEKEGETGSDPLYREKVENTFGLQCWPPAASY